MNVPVSDQDLRRCVPGAAVREYHQLAHASDIDQVLGPSGVCFLLYELRSGYGHWCLLLKRGDTVEVFDPLGMRPDDELKWVPAHFRPKANENVPHLTWLLEASPYKIGYNRHHLQENRVGVATCGRHCVVRAWNRDLPVDTYAKRLEVHARNAGMTPDSLVVSLTRPILGH